MHIEIIHNALKYIFKAIFLPLFRYVRDLSLPSLFLCPFPSLIQWKTVSWPEILSSNLLASFLHVYDCMSPSLVEAAWPFSDPGARFIWPPTHTPTLSLFPPSPSSLLPPTPVRPPVCPPPPLRQFPWAFPHSHQRTRLEGVLEHPALECECVNMRCVRVCVCVCFTRLCWFTVLFGLCWTFTRDDEARGWRAGSCALPGRIWHHEVWVAPA